MQITLDCEILKLFNSIIGELFSLWENSGKNETQELTTSKLKKKGNTQGKNSKFKEKTQNSRKKLKFSAYSYVGHGEEVAKL